MKAGPGPRSSKISAGPFKRQASGKKAGRGRKAGPSQKGRPCAKEAGPCREAGPWLLAKGRPVAKRQARALAKEAGPCHAVQRRHQSCQSVTPSRCPLAIDVQPVPRRNVNFG